MNQKFTGTRAVASNELEQLVTSYCQPGASHIIRTLPKNATLMFRVLKILVYKHPFPR